MTSHRYPTRAMAADYGRAAVGIALFGTLWFFHTAPVMAYILGAFGTLFLVFAARTALRHMTRIEVSTEAIRVVGPAGAVLRWRDLDAMTLGYYSTRRDGHGGWMHLKLKGASRTVKLDSSIDGFPIITRQALFAARANHVVLSPPTLENLAVLGIASDESAANA